MTHIINECAEITKSKGFDTSAHATQIALIATEVAEALECVTDSGVLTTDKFVYDTIHRCEQYEQYRKEAKQYTDRSEVKDLPHLLEELADVVIRVSSYVGGNGWEEQFNSILRDKVEKNRNRPRLHNKGF